MIQVLIATNRKGSRSSLLGSDIVERFRAQKQDCELMSLEDVDWSELSSNEYGADAIPASLKSKVEKINDADGVYLVVPEYNGSFPGVLKVFIDYFDYPKSFEFRPVCFTGLGGMFGGLRPVEQIQGVFGYRNSFMYPERVFIRNVWEVLSDDGAIKNDVISELLDNQVQGFIKFIDGLKKVELHCKSR